jgi:RHS repeat-associated protein
VTLDQARFVAALFTKTADTPTTSYYHVDAQGSVRAVSDDSGAIVIRHDYYTFGEDAQPLTGDPLRYAGKELDPETAQEYFGARYYRNVWGRFGTVDPIYSSAAVTDPQQWNRYAYARNNPLKFSDPLGAEVSDCASTGREQQPVTCNDYVNVSADAPVAMTVPPDPIGWSLSDPWCEGYDCDLYSIPSARNYFFRYKMIIIRAAYAGALNARRSHQAGGTSNSPSSEPSGDTGGDDSGGESHIKPAPAGIRRWNPCTKEALATAGAQIALDAVGLLPEAGGVARLIGHGAGYRGIVADRLGSSVIHAFSHATSVASGLSGLFDTSAKGLTSTALTVIGFVPVVGQFSSAGSLLMDVNDGLDALAACGS